jgi:hypothetical protein
MSVDIFGQKQFIIFGTDERRSKVPRIFGRTFTFSPGGQEAEPLPPPLVLIFLGVGDDTTILVVIIIVSNITTTNKQHAD